MRLFLYGTLMAGNGHSLARRLHDVLGPGQAAQVEGRMFVIPDPDGWYPALVPGEGCWVRGMVHAACGLDEALWTALDAFEEGYLRRDVIVEGGGCAQAYVWPDALPDGALALADGDFLAFLRRTGQRPYGAQDS
jgi:gamma-glutamylcyclotransferase (GGCT)/AIG2-like uncharacterized protein YtfP